MFTMDDNRSSRCGGDRGPARRAQPFHSSCFMTSDPPSRRFRSAGERQSVERRLPLVEQTSRRPVLRAFLSALGLGPRLALRRARSLGLGPRTALAGLGWVLVRLFADLAPWVGSVGLLRAALGLVCTAFAELAALSRILAGAHVVLLSCAPRARAARERLARTTRGPNRWFSTRRPGWLVAPNGGPWAAGWPRRCSSDKPLCCS